MAVHIHSLYRFPVKSMAGHSLLSAQLDRLGIAGDRRFMLVDAKGRFITQRKLGQMALISAQLEERGGLSFIDACNHDLICRVPPDYQGQSTKVRVWQDELVARDMGDEVAAALGARLGQYLRLVRFDSDVERQVDRDYANEGVHVGFADGFPLLIVSLASIAEVLEREPSQDDLLRFRANIIVDGCEAYAEDGWSAIDVGGTQIELLKPCARCVMPTINPGTGLREAGVSALLEKRRANDGQIYVGQNGVHAQAGLLRLKDPVLPIERC